MTAGLRRHRGEKPKEREEAFLAPLSWGARGTGVCRVISSGGLSPLTHLGPSPRLRTQNSDSGGSWGKWALSSGSLSGVGTTPSPSHPCPAPTLTHPGSSPSGGRSAAATVPSAAETVPCQAPWPEQASNRLSVRRSVHSIQSPRGSAPCAGMGRLLLAPPAAPPRCPLLPDNWSDGFRG